MSLTTDCATELDLTRLGQIVADLPAVLRTFGWDRLEGVLDYATAEDPETAFVLDLIALSRIDAAGRADAWARMDQHIERTGGLDRVAEAMAS